MTDLRVISLFTGCGGADLGVVGGFQYLNEWYGRHPASIVSASDINERSINTYNLNTSYFGAKAECIDIRSLSLTGYNEVSLVVGGFPCQSFSTVNPTKNPQNTETQLFWEMAERINEIKPEMFIAENVKGFYRLGEGKYFRLACENFEQLGYTVHHKLLNSVDYGVPQLRERLFIVGIRSDIKKSFNFPEPTHGNRFFDPHKPRVLNDVIDQSGVDPKYTFSEKAVVGAKNAKPNMKRLLAQNLDEPCLTITSHLAKVSINSRDPVLLIDKENEIYRRFTPWEAAAIQSFPKNFNFAGGEGDIYRQVGNAIPPIMMWRLMQSIVTQIFELPSGEFEVVGHDFS